MIDEPHHRTEEAGASRTFLAMIVILAFVMNMVGRGVTETLAGYKAHPLYQESINIVRPLREIRLAADYEIE